MWVSAGGRCEFLWVVFGVLLEVTSVGQTTGPIGGSFLLFLGIRPKTGYWSIGSWNHRLLSDSQLFWFPESWQPSWPLSLQPFQCLGGLQFPVFIFFLIEILRVASIFLTKPWLHHFIILYHDIKTWLLVERPRKIMRWRSKLSSFNSDNCETTTVSFTVGVEVFIKSNPLRKALRGNNLLHYTRRRLTLLRRYYSKWYLSGWEELIVQVFWILVVNEGERGPLAKIAN